MGNRPAFGPDPWWRRVLSLARRSISIGPRGERDNFLRGQRGAIRKLSHAGVREPRGHGLRLCGLADDRGIGPDLRIRFERHGRNAPGAMAFLTVALQNRQDIAVKRRRTPFSRSWRSFLRAPMRWSDPKGGAQKCHGAQSWLASHPTSLQRAAHPARFHLRRMASIFYNA